MVKIWRISRVKWVYTGASLTGAFLLFDYSCATVSSCRVGYDFSTFLVALSIHSLVYHLCANWKFHGSGCESLPSGVVLTKMDLRWNVAICLASSVLTSMEKRPSEGRWSAFSGESPQRTMTCSHIISMNARRVY
jgi:hypothetical protein